MNKNSAKVSIQMKAERQQKDDRSIDLELVKRCKEGDEMAFSQLVKRYQKKVYVVALGMVKNPDDAMDIAQDGFVKVHRYIKNFQGTSSFYTWLYRIVVNLSIDHLRKSGKWSGDEYDEQLHSSVTDNHPGGAVSTTLGENPSKNLGRKELAEQMRNAIQQLPPYHRAVILMREVEGMSYSEMAKTLKVSKGTVMSRLHHARAKMQSILKPYLEGDLMVE